MLEVTRIIRKPIVTEKVTWAMNELGRYTFQVDHRASKDEIKKAVEEIYNVKVVKVNTQNRKGESRRTKHGLTKLSDVKTATVRLKEGQVIELF